MKDISDYRKGDVVTVRHDLNTLHKNVVHSLIYYRGKKLTVDYIDNKWIKVKENTWWWQPHMFENEESNYEIY